MTNETLSIITSRRSCRSFKPEPVPADLVDAILEAGCAAPYANEPLCHFTVIQNAEVLEKLNKVAKEAATKMDLAHLKKLGEDPNFNSRYHAPVLIIVSAKENTVSPETDAAAATENILIAAEALGLGACWIFFTLFTFFGPKVTEWKKELKIPEGYKPYSSIALGFKNSPSEQRLEADLSTRITYIR
jgi:nitroreductase